MVVGWTWLFLMFTVVYFYLLKDFDFNLQVGATQRRHRRRLSQQRLHQTLLRDRGVIDHLILEIGDMSEKVNWQKEGF